MQKPRRASYGLELTAKRESLPSLHQEFEVSQTFRTRLSSRSFKWRIVLDMSRGQWREKTTSGSGDPMKIFNGIDHFWIDEGGNEYVRTKHRPTEEDSLPSPLQIQ